MTSAITAHHALVRPSNPSLFVSVRHRRNAWKECVPGRSLMPVGWEQIERQSMFSAGDLSSYERAAASL